MRVVSARYRTFVHATEDEDRVRDALLWVMGLLGQDRAADHVERKRLKGHFGNDILHLEAGHRSERLATQALRRLLADKALRAPLRESLAARLDEDRVLHLRLDKQEAVQRRLRLADSGDALVVQFKAVTAPGENPVTAWARLLDAAAVGPTNV